MVQRSQLTTGARRAVGPSWRRRLIAGALALALGCSAQAPTPQPPTDAEPVDALERDTGVAPTDSPSPTDGGDALPPRDALDVPSPLDAIDAPRLDTAVPVDVPAPFDAGDVPPSVDVRDAARDACNPDLGPCIPCGSLPGGCPTGTTCCDGFCTVTSLDPANCGRCGNACEFAYGVPACNAGVCRLSRCLPSFGDCDGDPSNGCETNRADNPRHCGACGTVCGGPHTTAAVCALGSCALTCEPGWADCDRMAATGCERALGDVDNCGACGTRCQYAHATPLCTSGRCALGPCAEGWANCDGDPSNGCETDLTTTARHCGTCGHACPVACSAGRCATVTGLSLGTSHSCATLSDATARCWGRNTMGQLGTGTTSAFYPDLRPAPVSWLAEAPEVAQVVAGQEHSCARLRDGTSRCWGYNGSGELGDGTTTRRLNPVTVTGLTNPLSLAASLWRTCALLPDATMRCWGSNGSGQLGDGTILPRYLPTLVPGLTAVTDLDLGVGHSCARRSDGTVRCWGSNASGELGDGTTTNRLSPVEVVGLSGAASVSLGEGHTCARMTDGTVRCWGRNLESQLGDGTATTRGSPAPVVGLTGVAQVDCGGFHTCARMTDGTVRCWGRGREGQLGDGLREDHPTPTPVPGVNNVVEVVSGRARTCVRRSDGGVLCWGDNANGELGDGTTLARPAPVAVLF